MTRSSVITTLISVASIALMIFTIYRTLSSFRRERPLNRATQYVAMASPTATLVVYLVGATPGGWYLAAVAAAGLLGAGFGLSWSRTTKLTMRGGRVVGENTVWWLLFWGPSFILTQGMTLLRQRTGLDLSLVLMSFSTGVAFTMALGLLRGIQAALEGAPTVGPVASSASYCNSCGSAVPASSSFCEQCGQRLA